MYVHSKYAFAENDTNYTFEKQEKHHFLDRKTGTS
jgi:hypothetical protein